ncbi:MAG: class I SAM-dependent methyltransferase [Rubricella sp.]
MDGLELLLDLHLGGARQGPGSDGETRQAIALSGLAGREGLRIADIGCGTGASTAILASDLDARIVAVDFLQPFLDRLQERAAREGWAGRVETLAASMDDLPFAEAEFDAIWSEGAIYNMGFTAGVRAWRRFLRPGGILAVSELTWLTATRPAELDAHWQAEYPEVATAGEKIAILEREGFTPVGYFPLSTEAWMANYYEPLRSRLPAFLERHDHSEAARAIAEAEEAEIALYERFADYVSYGFYVARRSGP